MARTADDVRRAELLERIVDYVLDNGVAGLSLRPLALAVSSSPRVLLYYFASKEDLIVEILERARHRQQASLDRLKALRGSSRDVCRAAWRIISDRQTEPLYRLFFEVFGLALQNRDRFPGFLERAVGDWLSFLEKPALQQGYTSSQARSFATIVLAGFRGFLMDLCASGDRTRVGRAVEIWLEALPYA